MNISAYRADYLPLLGQLMNQMKLPQIINEAVTKPNSQAIVDAGTMISGMIFHGNQTFLHPISPKSVQAMFLMNSKIEKEKLELMKKADGENKREFFCEADARAEIDKFQKENKSRFHIITSEIIEVEKTIKRNKRGRLKNGEIPSKEKRFLVNR